MCPYFLLLILQRSISGLVLLICGILQYYCMPGLTPYNRQLKLFHPLGEPNFGMFPATFYGLYEPQNKGSGFIIMCS